MDKRFTILVVDDDAVNTQLINSALKDEYDILPAYNGHEAINMLKQYEPDLILLDVMMPDLNGFEVCSIIKADEAFVDIPIIFLTASLETIEGELHGLELGAIDYLVKPVNLALLKLRIRNHLALKERNDLVKEQRDLLTRHKEELAQLLAEQELQNKQLLETKAALRQSEEMYRTLFEQSPDGIVLWSVPDLRAVQCNTAAQTLHGYSHEEFTSLTVPDIEAALNPVEVENTRNTLLRDGVARFDSVHRTKTGELRSMFVSLKTIELAGQSMILDIHRDITERKRAEDALKESEWKFQALFDNGPIGVAYHSMIYDDSGKAVDYRFIDANEKYIELTGVDPRGKTVLQAFPGIENDPFDWIGTFGDVARTGESIRFEQYLQPNDRWYDVVGYQYKPDHFVAAFFEITERKRVEASLKIFENRQAKMIANIGDVIVIIDQHGINRYKSPNVEKWFGWKPEELVGASAWANVHPDDLASSQKFVSDLVSNPNTTGTTECRYRCKDGSYKWIEITLINLLDYPEIQGILGDYHDITERRRFEDEKRAIEQQLQQTQKLESLGVLAGGIAHDFNNILAIIIGHCSLAAMDPETANKHIPPIEKAADRAAGLCRQMLAYAGKASFTLTQVNMAALVDEMVQMLKATTNQNVAIKPDLSTDVPTINGDASQLRQIVMNLIINASEAIGEAQGVIHVSLTKTAIKAGQSSTDHLGKAIPTGWYVCLEVSDTGCGMDEETRRRIFEPFYTTKFAGRGLGMSAVLGIITAHRGALQLTSQPGQGTTFTIYLPIETNDPIGDESSEQIAPTPWQGSGTALLVEDEDQVKLVAKAMLEALGFNVIEASNGREALDLYQNNATAITLVLTDIGMPIMDGYTLFRELKSLKPELPIIISSGFGDTVVTTRIPAEEIAGLVSKPYRFDQLRAVLRVVEEGCQKQE